ncbi:MAG: hypothetical protein M1819_004817 [Sarea resinae]|nr:MAG: hypothetical protein M1819_004817 [Sarea resinae]
MVEKKIEETLTVLWEDLPHWMQDNHYIRGSYRPVSNSYLGSFASLGYLHNESVNIYSHLLGAIVFSIISVFLYNILEPRYATSSRADVIAFGCFFLGVAVCLGMSATYHAISNHSPEVSRFGNKLDYIGIVFLITGSFVPSIYYGFYCHPTLYKLYWTMISSLGFGCAVVSSLNRFRTPQWRTFRASMFVALGLSAVIPVLHGLDMYGVEGLEARMALFWVILQGSLYIIGAAIYAARIPERIRPGAFDVFGSSHQIFHFLVVAAAASHLIGLIKAFDYNHRTGARCG